MLIHCPSKRCNTTREHRLRIDVKDSIREVICLECSEVNDMVSEFMKTAMQAAGDILRIPQGRKAFMYKCHKCGIERGVKIKDEQAFCEVCEHPLNLATPTVEAIKTNINKDELNKGVVKRKRS